MSATPHRGDQPGRTARLLVVTAVAAERDAVAEGLRRAGALVDGATGAAGFPGAADGPVPAADAHRAAGGGPEAVVLAAGVGPAAAAAAAAGALADAAARSRPFHLVVCAGIAGGFAPAAPVGSAVLADAVVAADLGATTPDGFADVAELGFGTVRHLPPKPAVDLAAAALRAAGIPTAVGPVLTVSTVTGTAERAAGLAARHPGAAAEAMEGFGAAEAADRYGVPVLELRTVSNAVGPRDRAAWRIGEALETLRQAFAALPLRELTDTAAAGTAAKESS
ncbi:futalosine hydrolase [Streptacidiphilus sp. ASG 303]|uniref:futalosine hydrolase n=1 Tax=Streptacidiphilus sp. ASG 303 TaxID=2896847 RepID=UPI001E60C70F|nr:futalosine hydrolase [Streptacidiphilus sp. ASG 303]MCD0485740.1 futalosine hydrolase [Streptacidiphilus sp. ASG 303]